MQITTKPWSVEWCGSPLVTTQVYVEGNMANISPTIPINISKTPSVVENVLFGTYCSLEKIVVYTTLFKEYRDIFYWSYKEIPGIDSTNIEHEIKTYPIVKPV